MKKIKTIILSKKPAGCLTEDCFSVKKIAVRDISSEEVLVKVKIISIDAATRAWLQGPTYRKEVLVRDVIPAYGIAEVVDSRSNNFAKGDIVSGEFEWSDYAIRRSNLLTKIKSPQNLSDHLTYKGIAGLTAFHGLMDIAKVKKSDSVLISTAAGSVGMLACQIAKARGCKVIGLSGSDEKCNWVESNLGLRKCLNYNDQTFFEHLKESYPKGIDVYFDNVGGRLLEKILYKMKIGGRVICCGAISQYDNERVKPPRNIPGIIVTKRLKLEGFIVMDFYKKWHETIKILSNWHKTGEIKVFTDEYQGLNCAPRALINLLQGKNLGKTIVKL